MHAAIFGDEQARDLALNIGGDQHRPRLGQGLNARGDIWRVAKHLAHRIDDNEPRV